MHQTGLEGPQPGERKQEKQWEQQTFYLSGANMTLSLFVFFLTAFMGSLGASIAGDLPLVIPSIWRMQFSAAHYVLFFTPS